MCALADASLPPGAMHCMGAGLPDVHSSKYAAVCAAASDFVVQGSEPDMAYFDVFVSATTTGYLKLMFVRSFELSAAQRTCFVCVYCLGAAEHKQTSKIVL